KHVLSAIEYESMIAYVEEFDENFDEDNEPHWTISLGFLLVSLMISLFGKLLVVVAYVSLSLSSCCDVDVTIGVRFEVLRNMTRFSFVDDGMLVSFADADAAADTHDDAAKTRYLLGLTFIVVDLLHSTLCRESTPHRRWHCSWPHLAYYRQPL